MARTTRPTTDKYDFPVEMQELYTKDNQKAGFWGTRRTDTGQVLGVTSDKYGLLLNTDLVNAVDEVLTGKGLDYERKISVARDGATMYGRYEFPNELRKIQKVGDEMGMRITIRNSYDRTSFAGLELGMLRLVCTNGMKAMKRAFGFNQKHSRKLSLDGVSDAIERAITAFDDVGGDFTILSDMKIDDTIGDYVLKNLTSDKILSDKLREEITKVWLNPPFPEDKDRNLYNLYNAVTYHLTHKVESKRFEYADKVNSNVLNRFVKASRNTSDFKKLTRIPTPTKGSILVAG
jgi:hypothetical protein